MQFVSCESVPSIQKTNKAVLDILAALEDAESGVIQVMGLDKPRSMATTINRYARANNLTVRAITRENKVLYVEQKVVDTQVTKED